MIIVDYIQIVHNNMSRWVMVAQRMKTITLTGRVPLDLWSRNYLPFRSTWVHTGCWGSIVSSVILYCLSFYLRFLITSVIFFDHCIACPPIYGFWLPLWYFLTIVLPVLLFTVSDYLCDILWPLYCLSFYLRFLITSVIFFDHCIVCPSIYGFWLPHFVSSNFSYVFL